MKKELADVKAFNDAYRTKYNTQPMLPSIKQRKLRMNLLLEECKELEQAFKEGDLVESADAIVDILYIVFGGAHDLGIAEKLPELFAEVHRSNMTKLDVNGNPIYNEHGKVIKGPNYEKPQLASILFPDLLD